MKKEITDDMGEELNIVPVDASNRATFDRLIQCYECEFSAITEKQPTAEGVFPLDTHLDDCHEGFLAYLGDIPVGFSVIALKPDECYEVCEFFIVPVFRKKHLGYHLTASVFDRYPGSWEVKQIAGADDAMAFWRKAIDRYTDGEYQEDIYSDPYWGTVTRQRFRNVG